MYLVLPRNLGKIEKMFLFCIIILYLLRLLDFKHWRIIQGRTSSYGIYIVNLFLISVI
jgi:hypothetical protein